MATPPAARWVQLRGVLSPAVAAHRGALLPHAGEPFTVLGTQPPPHQLLIAINERIHASLSVDEAIGCGVRPRSPAACRAAAERAVADECFLGLARATLTPSPRRCCQCLGGVKPPELGQRPPQSKTPTPVKGRLPPEAPLPSDEEFYAAVLGMEGNNRCADCSKKETLTWGASNLGVVLCSECVGGHRDIGARFSKPLSLLLDNWSPEHKRTMLSTGNRAVNAVYEAHKAVATLKPSPTSDIESKFDYVRAKYQRKAFHRDGDGQVVRSRKKSKALLGTQEHAGVVIVEVLNASNLMGLDYDGKSDPYVVLSSRSGDKMKSSVIHNTLNPVWNETLQLNVNNPTDPILLQVKDKDILTSDDPLGDTEIYLQDMQPMKATKLTQELHVWKAGKRVPAGTIRLEVTWYPLQ
ncbi:hypothetical protein AB1Y20_006167 [Prymnesium parvum]|uniref:ADP-ribosylation factor GTPase-activating protein AGD13 n=1 Tax=Prymnesium parvum TaxID=97485 RepID=A0AB34J3E0_PRYPA